MSSDPRVRRRARVLAVQALYLMEMAGTPAATALRTAVHLSGEVDEPVDVPELPYAEHLVVEVERNRGLIDRLLGDSGTRWRIDRMSALDLQVLRVAVGELLAPSVELPTPVVIDEAVEVAKAFGGESSPGFVNGVLDAVAREMRRDGLATGERERG